jgi:hypothetical protein
MPDSRKRGRPPLDATQPAVRLEVLVTARDYDRAYLRARTQDVSIPELVRRGLRRLLADEDEHDA